MEKSTVSNTYRRKVGQFAGNEQTRPAGEKL